MLNPTADRDNSILWARDLLKRDNWVILDTETTGLKDAEICQIGILAPSGKVLLDALVKPSCPIPADVTAIHGICDGDVQIAISPRSLLTCLEEISRDTALVIYNAQYDLSVLQNVCRKALDIEWARSRPSICAMLKYSAFVGEIGYRGDYKWQKLPGARAHSAIDDCRATLDVIKLMAAAKLSTEGEVANG